MLTKGRLPHKFQAAAQDNKATQGKTTTTASTRRAANTSPVLAGGALRRPGELLEAQRNEAERDQRHHRHRPHWRQQRHLHHWANVGSDRQCQLDAMEDVFGLRPWN